MHGKLSFIEEGEIAKFIAEKNIKILNLCHIPEDSRLKTLSFSASDRQKVNEILELGERADGSSLFSFIEPEKSDIYIMPRIERTFVNPFSTVPTLNILCEYLDENGKPLSVAPRNVLARAEEKLHDTRGTVLKALAELECYIIAKPQTEILFPGASDRNYHESAPFALFECLRNEIMVTMADIGIDTKYGHSEVGLIHGKDGSYMEQQEIELAPQSLTDLAETISIAKWVIRNTCAKHGVSASFSPKLTLEHVGNGMHIHLCGFKKDKDIIAESNGTLSVEARKIIGGILKLAPSLSAFGNPAPISYLRFIARKESPMQICWSARNRLALVRIPLWWSYKEKSMEANSCRKTFEYRAPDALANAYLLLAGIAVAANHGFKNPEESLKVAEDLNVEELKQKRKSLKTLPQSCWEAAENLENERSFYEANGVFQKKLINTTIEKLKSYRDQNMWTKLIDKPDRIEKVLKQYLHDG